MMPVPHADSDRGPGPSAWAWGLLAMSGALAVLAWPGPLAAQVAAPDLGDEYYEAVPGWPRPLHPDLDWSRTGAVFAESPNRVFVFQTGELPLGYRTSPANDPRHPNWPGRQFPSATYCGTVGFTCAPGQAPLLDAPTRQPITGSRWEHLLLVIDGDGRLVESWDQWNHLFTHPHGVLINPYDPEKHVWVVDDGSEQIFKFTHDGQRLVLSLGQFRVRGDDATHLGGPNGMAFLPNGDFFVTDGYKNARVVKYSKDGTYLMHWGTRGNGPGQFNVPHSVEIGPDGRVYVGDRGNQRIQVFDQQGRYLSEIMAVYPNALAISHDQRYLYVAQGGPDAASEIRTYTLDGRLLASWGRPFGNQPGQLWGVHDFSRDSDGNLYFAQSWGGRAWKYRVRPGATPLFGAFKKNTF